MKKIDPKKSSCNPGRWVRTILGILYVLVGLIGAFVILYKPDLVTLIPLPVGMESKLAGRLLWCFGWSLIGFGVTTISRSKVEKQCPFPSHLYFYPTFLIANSLLIFGILNLSDKENFSFYYPISAWFCFNMGFWIDVVVRWFERSAETFLQVVEKYLTPK